MTRIWLVADDYGISKSVNSAIRDLVARRRINATSVMVVAPGFDEEQAKLLAASAAGGNAAIGLHLTLTAPFKPLATAYRPLNKGAFLPLGRTFLFGMFDHLPRSEITGEVRAQVAAFISAFGRPPDFIDGHQHVHLLPPVAESLLAVMCEMAPHAWVRQCGSARGVAVRDIKARVLDAMSYGFRRRAARHGVHTNSAFAGTYDFRFGSRFDALFPKFLAGMPEGGLVMCHPGLVDDMLRTLDPLTDLRQKEYDYFRGEDFVSALAERHIALY